MAEVKAINRITGKELIEVQKWKMKELELADTHCIEIQHPTNKKLCQHLCNMTRQEFNELVFFYDFKLGWRPLN